MARNRKHNAMTFLVDGINLGLTKMAEACPSSAKSSLKDIQVSYTRDETARLVPHSGSLAAGTSRTAD